MNSVLRNTGICHLILSQFLKEGHTVVDATAGNGHDTLFLAAKVGTSGKVYAFDIQEKALEKTRQLLAQHHLLDRVVLINDGHEKLADYINEPLQCLVYNLGYLPGGDKKVITSAATTLLSLSQGLQYLRPGGTAAVTVYPGHPGGAEEAEKVEHYLCSLPSDRWQVFTWKNANCRGKSAPYLIFVWKKEDIEVGI